MFGVGRRKSLARSLVRFIQHFCDVLIMIGDDEPEKGIDNTPVTGPITYKILISKISLTLLLRLVLRAFGCTFFSARPHHHFKIRMFYSTKILCKVKLDPAYH